MEKLEWNVFVEDINRKTITPYNVLQPHIVETIKKDIKHIKKENNITKGTIVDKTLAHNIYTQVCDRIKSIMMYYYWSKCEWEIVLSEWPPCDKPEYQIREKIDVYDQLRLNWDIFCQYVYNKLYK